MDDWVFASGLRNTPQTLLKNDKGHANTLGTFMEEGTNYKERR